MYFKNEQSHGWTGWGLRIFVRRVSRASILTQMRSLSFNRAWNPTFQGAFEGPEVTTGSVGWEWRWGGQLWSMGNRKWEGVGKLFLINCPKEWIFPIALHRYSTGLCRTYWVPCGSLGMKQQPVHCFLAIPAYFSFSPFSYQQVTSALDSIIWGTQNRMAVG